MEKIKNEYFIKLDGNIPIELINETSSWQSILIENLPFIITVLIVMAAATVTYRSNRASVESQNDMATKSRQEEHENKISEFRHQWLQEVRETGADLCQIVHELQFFSIQRNIAVDNMHEATNNGDDEVYSEFKKTASESYQSLIKIRSTYYKLTSKLKMLFKMDEPETKALFKILNEVKLDIYDFNKTKLKDDQVERIIEELQKILKTEWDVTKARSWEMPLNESVH